MPESLRQRLAAAIDAVGELAVARQLHCSRLTVVRGAAGLGVTSGTLALVKERLGSVSPKPAPSSVPGTGVSH